MTMCTLLETAGVSRIIIGDGDLADCDEVSKVRIGHSVPLSPLKSHRHDIHTHKAPAIDAGSKQGVDQVGTASNVQPLYHLQVWPDLL